MKSTVVACLLGLSAIHGAGFTILEQSATGIGRSLAGMTTDYNDPASIYFNPSTAGYFTDTKLSLGCHSMYVQAYFKNKGSSPELGDNVSGNAGGWVFIPNIYYGMPLSSTVGFGLGTSATSGTRQTYNKRWIGRYTGTDTEITVMDINPTIGWKVSESVSVGAGLALEYCKTTLKQMVNVGTNDAELSASGDSYAIGFTLGLTYLPFDGTRIGLGYRSRMSHDLDLKARVKHGGEFARQNGSRSHGDAVLNLPSMINFGISQKINSQWSVMLDISWSEWSRMKELKIKFDDPILGQKRSTQEMNWRDNWRIAFGGEYKHNDKLTFRMGTAYDQTPVKNGYRNSRLPDSDRFWLSAGVGYQFTEHLRGDLSYVHIFFPRVSYEQPCDSLGNKYYVRGKAYGLCEIISASLTYTF